MTIFARKVDTGEVVWAYQMTPFDQWDYDGVNENMLTDMDIDGKKVKALTHFDRNGFAYVLDRTDGTLLRANKYVTVDWAEKIDLKTGRPIKVQASILRSPLAATFRPAHRPWAARTSSPALGRSQRAEHVLLPHQQLVHGGRAPAAHAHQPGHRLCVRQRVHVSREAWRHRQVQEVRRADRQDRLGDPGSLSELGRRPGHRRWARVLRHLGGDFRAVDRKSGKVLWSRKLGSGIIGNPITYKVDGKQYVSMYAGIGGWIGLPVTAGLDMNDKFGAIGATAMAKAAQLDKIPQGWHALHLQSLI